MRPSPRSGFSLPARLAPSTLLIASAVLALVAGLLPATAASATTATPEPTPAATAPAAPVAEPTPAPTPAAPSATPTAAPGPETEYEKPPVAQVAREDLSEVVAETPLKESDAAGDVTLDVADPGNVPFPAGGSSGSVDGASGARLSLSLPQAAAVPAAAVAGFSAGNIISDAVFSKKGAMTEAAVRSFIAGKVATCQKGYVCLEMYKETTPTRAADAYCAKYTGGANEDAARIVFKVAQACNVNPQVLLVMLQKEQGLVTHTWPSNFRYTIAMGMGCPDTAECDTRYYGFFNQVYGAARQMQIYAKTNYFPAYKPGGTRRIGYHPNASCGASGVYVQNQATTNLYTYTPYQPNAAALAAGFGTGDSCSSYGNRNFYNYFKTWFGSTGAGLPTPTSGLIRSSTGTAVYLVMDGGKHHVPTADDLRAFQSRLGAIVQVAQSYVDSLPTRAPITRYVHDARTGTLYLLEPDGSKHRFVSQAQVTMFGYPFSSYVNLSAAYADKFTTGHEVGEFIRSEQDAAIYSTDGKTKRHIFDYTAWTKLKARTDGYVASMRADVAAKIPLGATIFQDNRLVRASDDPKVYLTLPGGSLLWVPSFDLAAEFAATTYTVVSPSVIAKNPVTTGALAPIVKCGTSTQIAAGGKLRPVSGTGLAGLTALPLTDAACAAFPRYSTAVTAPFFIQPTGRGEVYAMDRGKLRHVQSYATLLKLNPISTAPRILPWREGTVKWLGTTAPYLAEGSFVRFSGAGEVYRYSGGALHHVRTYESLVRLGGGRVPAIQTLSASFKSFYKIGAVIA